MGDVNEVKLEVDSFEDPDALPDEIAELLDLFPFIIGGEQDTELELIQTGRCCVCHRTFGEDTVVVLNSAGISTISCSTLCHDDLIRLGHLNEQAQDIMDSIHARRTISGGHD